MGESTTFAEERRGGEKEDRRTWVIASSSNDGSSVFLNRPSAWLGFTLLCPFYFPMSLFGFPGFGVFTACDRLVVSRDILDTWIMVVLCVRW